MEQRKALLKKARTYPRPLSFCWRSTHFTAYIIGGVTFFFGSLCYFTAGPLAGDYEAGGWLFTIGSVAFLFADIFEWNMNNRVGCWDTADERVEWESKNSGYLTHARSLFCCCPPSQGWQRAENGINFSYSAFGSFLYLVGSILFIPELGQITNGTWVFIWGSAVIFTSQSWKLYRYESLFDDTPAVLIDLFAGLGGLFYLVGSVFFLPQYDVSDAITNEAATWFTSGGSAFTLSGIAMLYRYFIASPPMYETN